MDNFFKTLIQEKKEFNRIGYHYKQVMDYGDNIYLYKMTPTNFKLNYSQYELVIGVKRRQPDGSVVYVYPSDEQFGTYGWYICGPEDRCQASIQELLCGIRNKSLIKVH